MNAYIIILLVVLFLVGSINLVIPTKKTRMLSDLRLLARKKGFQISSLTSKQKFVDERLLSEFFQKYNIKFNDIDSAISDFRDKREKLRSNKQYGEADKMREDLLEIGIVINDGENVGWYWKNS